MPAISITTVGIADPAPYPELADRLNYSPNPIEFVVLNAGMASGAPSVQILCRHALADGGHVVLETSLQALITATHAATVMAETRFGWRPVAADDLSPHLRASADEIERLRAEVRRHHRLNGWSKQKGWWCSCGAPLWSRFTGYLDDQGKDIVPWSDEGRARVLPEHAEHVRRIVEGS